MAITKEKLIDEITIIEDGTVLYREATKISEDGVILTKTYHRTSLEPGADLSGQPTNVVAICQMFWTPEVIAAYQEKMANINQAMQQGI
jgi:hypothetical protein